MILEKTIIVERAEEYKKTMDSERARAQTLTGLGPLLLTKCKMGWIMGGGKS